MPSHRPEIRYATIFVYPPCDKGGAPIVSTSPERLTAKPGEVVDWTIVDSTGAIRPSRVSIRWRDRSPVEKEPSFRRARFSRVVVADVPTGRYKYSIAIDGKVVFDPELEIMN